jgi:chromosome transmission fidelity protein 18
VFQCCTYFFNFTASGDKKPAPMHHEAMYDANFSLISSPTLIPKDIEAADPTKPQIIQATTNISVVESLSLLRQTPDNLPFVGSFLDPQSELNLPAMTFSSSPVLYPASSSPQLPTKKRRLFQTLEPPIPIKKPRVRGGFEEDEEETEQSCTNYAAATTLSQATDLLHATLANPDKIFEVQPPPLDHASPSLPPLPRVFLRKLPAKSLDIQSSSGDVCKIPLRTRAKAESFEQTIAQRSSVAPGRAKTAYYGVDIHKLVEEAKIMRQLDDAQKEFQKQQPPITPVQRPESQGSDSTKTSHQLWTEKYRAKKFSELVGDERTHRLVLKWLRGWDDVVFPGNKKSRPKQLFQDRKEDSDRQHRKILLLTGPPGLGKTTLAHVCAKQAGYEALEINASDDRSRDVVRGRIKDALATESVRGIKEHGKDRKPGRPVCVIVDEVDGVVTGSGGSGEGGFIKALIDLVQLNFRNSSQSSKVSSENGKKRKGDRFRFLRPLILICNDVYAPSLRPLRTSTFAEIVHVRRPAIEKLIIRLKSVFEAEKVACDNDAVRRICESSWGMGTRKQNSLGGRGAGEGDIRGILVHAEWIVRKFRSSSETGSSSRLSRRWIETHLEASQSAKDQKGLGRGGVREVIDRIFVEGAGLPNLPTALSAEDARLVAESKATSVGVADLRKRAAITSLREMMDTCGDHDRVMTDCFATYATQTFQDDVQLSKPNQAYDWLHFHDCLSKRVYGSQDWELNPYLSTGACGFHDLFASVDKGDRNWNEDKKEDGEADSHPFSGLRADFAAHEIEKANRTILTELRSSFAPSLLRFLSSVDAISTELMPAVARILAPDVKPVVIGGSGGAASTASVRKESEKMCVQNCVRVMGALDVRFEKAKVEAESAHTRGGFIYRMEP